MDFPPSAPPGSGRHVVIKSLKNYSTLQKKKEKKRKEKKREEKKRKEKKRKEKKKLMSTDSQWWLLIIIAHGIVELWNHFDSYKQFLRKIQAE